MTAPEAPATTRRERFVAFLATQAKSPEDVEINDALTQLFDAGRITWDENAGEITERH